MAQVSAKTNFSSVVRKAGYFGYKKSQVSVQAINKQLYQSSSQKFLNNIKQQQQQQYKCSYKGVRQTITIRSQKQEQQWKGATVTKSEKLNDKLTYVSLDVGDFCKGYSLAGQFVTVKVNDDLKPSYFAIANPPYTLANENANPTELQILVKREEGTTSDAFGGLDEGSSVFTSPVIGNGFAIDKIEASKYPNLLLFATGTGIAPIKALIESGTLELKQRKCAKLFYGAKNPELMAFKDSIKEWESLGVQVIPVYSEDGRGYVQDILQKDLEAGNVTITNKDNKVEEGTAVILAGQKQMVQALKETLIPRGVEEDKFLSNF